jgi:hypothetical protein
VQGKSRGDAVVFRNVEMSRGDGLRAACVAPISKFDTVEMDPNMICERGGCPGSNGKDPHPVYAVILMLPLVALFMIAKYFGFIAG